MKSYCILYDGKWISLLQSILHKKLTFSSTLVLFLLISFEFVDVLSHFQKSSSSIGYKMISSEQIEASSRTWSYINFSKAQRCSEALQLLNTLIYSKNIGYHQSQKLKITYFDGELKKLELNDFTYPDRRLKLFEFVKIHRHLINFMAEH